jgi:hypothetical protein
MGFRQPVQINKEEPQVTDKYADFWKEDSDMIGFIILIVGVIYLAVVVVVTRAAYRWAKGKGLSKTKCRLAAAGGFLVVYLPVFWDHIPTVVAHQYYCAKDSGFWVYKTVDQWKAENPRVMERLLSYNKNPGGFNVEWPSRHELRDDGRNKISTNQVNERFIVVVSWQDISDILLITKHESVLIDVKTNDVLARYADFGAGNSVKNAVGPPGPLKFWLRSSNCIDGKEQQARFGNFYLEFEGARK